jgi:hypothetical protein
MLVVVVYALAVFVLCFVSIRFLHRKIPTLAIVVFWTLIAPILMQVANLLLVGYLDPFWTWAATIQAAVALVASMAALMISAAIESDGKAK